MRPAHTTRVFEHRGLAAGSSKGVLVQGFEPLRGAVLRAEVVDLRRLHISYDLKARRRVGEVAVVEVEVLRVEAGDALRVERARATDDAVHRI